MDASRLWTKNFVFVTCINFFIATNYYLLMVVIAAYAMAAFGCPLSEAGLASGIFVIGTLVARFFSGRMIERIGRKKMLLAGTVLSLAMTLLYFAVGNIGTLFVIRFVHGMAYGIGATATGTIVANIVPRNRQGEGIGYFMLSMTIATAIGPFLGMVLTQHGSYNLVFIACAVSAALSIVNVFVLAVPEMQLTKEQASEIKGFKWKNFFEIRALPISVISAIIYFGYASILSFLTVYAKEIKLVDAASFFFIVYAVAILATRPFTGRLFDTKGENATMYPAFLAFAIGMVLLSQARSGMILLLAGALLGFGLGVVQSCGQAVAIKVTPQHRFGLAVSTFFIFADIGVGIGPFVLGLFVPVAGYRGVYMGMAVVSFACILLYYLLHGRKAAHCKEGKTAPQ